MKSLSYILRNHSQIILFRDQYYYSSLEKYLKGCNSVLDVGCGENSPLGMVKKTFKSEGVDIFNVSLLKSKKKHIHDKYTNCDIKKIDKIYKEKSFDAVIALDVIEHFKKNEAKLLIKKMEKIAKKKVILLTPNGFYKQDDIAGNPYQVHQSGWSKRDFERMGYSVRGLRGLKYLRGDYASIKYRPWIIFAILSFISERALYYFPTFSYDLFGVKNIK